MHSRLTNSNSNIVKKTASPDLKPVKTSSVSSTSSASTSRTISSRKSVREPIKKASSPPSSPSSVRKSLSPVSRINTLSSSSNLRRNSSLYAASHPTNVNIQEYEEITNLNTQLNQWIYLNAMTSDAYESQKKEAEKQLYDGYKYVVKQKNIYNSLNEDYFNKSNLIKVNEDLDIQNESIVTIENQLNKFKQIYEDFLIALHSTASKMTTQGIITNDIENLTKQFNECEKNLKILTEEKKKLEKVTINYY
ncbi:hypothetical protein U3516DRAFT_556036 [Neocallimastix sp. 'constans']